MQILLIDYISNHKDRKVTKNLDLFGRERPSLVTFVPLWLLIIKVKTNELKGMIPC